MTDQTILRLPNLPKWAQTLFEDQRREIKQLQKDLEMIQLIDQNETNPPDDSKIILIDLPLQSTHSYRTNKKIWIPTQSKVEFVFGHHESITIGFNDDNQLNIHADSYKKRLAALPVVSNVINIELI